MPDKRQSKSISLFTVGSVTTVSIALVLFLLGLIFVVGTTAAGLENYLKENMGLSIRLSDHVDDTRVSKIKQKLLSVEYVKSVQYISKDQVKKQLIRDLGDDPQSVLGYDPSHCYLDVYLKPQYVNTDSIAMIKNSLRTITLSGQNVIDNVNYNDSDLAYATSNLSLLGTVLFIFLIVLVIISFALIKSIIQLNIYSKRFLINTMQLVGATNSFIRKPFVKRMLVQGIFAAVIADICLTAVYFYLQRAVPQITALIHWNNLLLIYGLVFVFGVLISVLAAVFSVNRYLKMTSNKLYYV